MMLGDDAMEPRPLIGERSELITGEPCELTEGRGLLSNVKNQKFTGFSQEGMTENRI